MTRTPVSASPSAALAHAAAPLADERLSLLADAFPGPLALFDADDRLVVANAPFRERYAALADALRPGLGYEDFVRLDVSAGPDARDEARREHRARERMRWHRQGGGELTLGEKAGRRVHARETRSAGLGTCLMLEDAGGESSREWALRESAQSFRRMVDGSVQGVLIQRDWVPLYANDACARLLGYASPDEVLALGTTTRIFAGHEHERMRGYQAARRAAEEAPVHYEVEVVRKDGTLRTVRTVVELTSWNGRQATLHCMLDVTDHRRALDRAEREHELLQKVVSHSPVILWSVDSAGTIELSEGQGLLAQGARPGELVGRSIFDVYRDHPDFLANVQRAMAGESFSAENETAGAVYERWFEPVRDPDGRVIGVIGVSVDITGRKRVERELRRHQESLEQRVAERTAALKASEQRLHAILESSPVGVSIMARETSERLYVNPAWLRMFGAPDLASSNRIALVDTYVDGADLERLRAEFDAHGTVRGYEVERRRLDGTRWWAQLDLLPAEFGGRPAVIVWHYDVTVRRQAAEALRAAKEEAERQARTAQEARAGLEVVNRELEAFSYSVSHDLRQPLRAIDGFSEAVLEDHADRLDDTARDYLQRVRRGSQRMADIIDGLLTLSRVTRTSMQPQETRLDLLAEDVVADLRHAEPQREVTVRVQEGLSAVGDPRLLRAVLANLIGNAWKFTERTQDARIEVLAEDGAFVVRDNGAGFDMQYARKLFEPFQRLHGTGEYEGLGIGLVTVRRIVERHGGRVWARGRPGEGASFHFTLGGAPS